MSFHTYRFFFSFLLILTLGACNDRGSTPSNTNNAPSARGSLNVVVSGLPADVRPSIVISGSDQYSQAVQTSQTFFGLMPGVYTVAADKVLDGTNTYGPQTANQTVTVNPGGAETAGVTYALQGTLALELQEIVTGLTQPIFLTAPTGDARLFIVERPGRIRIVQDGALLPTPFLDIHERTTIEGERGLLSMEFDPQFVTNGFFYVYYTSLDGAITIERFTVSSTDPNVADALSGLSILSIPHSTFNNHNGGLLSFGPDGYLYLATGDGGSSGDPQGNAQNTNSLLGKVLRINVSAATPEQPYSIPPANPFVNQDGKRGEIWAYGLRNPWRFAFDNTNSLLYIADVGQERREEVNVAGVDQAGLNYGWSIMEGTICYPANASCNQQGLTLPVLDYDHGDNNSNGCSITGGYVYRGSALPELNGHYFYSDLCSGALKSFVYLNGVATQKTDWDIQNVAPIYSFGQDAQKELYILSGTGTVYRIVRQ